METIWPIKKLGEVCQFQFGFSFTASEFNNSAKGMPVIRIGDIDKGVTEKFFDGKFDKRYMVKKGDILIGLSGTIKIAKWVGIDSLLNQRVVKLRDFQDVLPDYLYYFLPQALHDLERKLSGGIIKNVLLPHLENLKILLPSFSEQKKIVEKIEKLFAKIDEASRLRAESSTASAALLPSALHQIFFRAEKEEWSTKKLGEVCDFKNGLWKGKKSPFKIARVLRNTNFRNGGYLDLGNIAEIEVEKKQLAERLLQKGDLILERSGGGPIQPVGRVVYFDAVGEFSFSNFTTRIRIKNPKELYDKYLWRYLNQLYISGVTETMQKQTTGIRNLNFSEYKNLKIPLPPIAEQKKIVAYLDAFSAKTRELQNLQKETATDFSALRQSVLAKTFKQL